MGFTLPLMGGIHTNLRPEPRHGGGEVEVIDRGVFNDGAVSGGIHAGRHGPDHVFPGSRVYVVVSNNDELGVHELAQK